MVVAVQQFTSTTEYKLAFLVSGGDYHQSIVERTKRGAASRKFSVVVAMTTIRSYVRHFVETDTEELKKGYLCKNCIHRACTSILCRLVSINTYHT